MPVFMRTNWTFSFSPFKLSEILKFGLDKLLSSEGSTVDEIDLETILGETKNGQWISDTLPTAEEGIQEQEEGSKWGVKVEQMAQLPDLDVSEIGPDRKAWRVLPGASFPTQPYSHCGHTVEVFLGLRTLPRLTSNCLFPCS